MTWTFDILIVVCPGRSIFEFIFLEFVEFLECSYSSFITFWKFLAIVSLNILSALFSLFFPWGTPINHMMVSYRSLSLCFISFHLFSVSHTLYFLLSYLQICCFFILPLNLSRWIFHFSYILFSSRISFGFFLDFLSLCILLVLFLTLFMPSFCCFSIFRIIVLNSSSNISAINSFSK